MIRTRQKVSFRKSIKRIAAKRTNIHIDTILVHKISSQTRLKSQRAIVDFALRTTAELLERRNRIGKMSNAMSGLTKGTGIFPPGYAEYIRGR
jgi:Arc/MetJ family transcription regulator